MLTFAPTNDTWLEDFVPELTSPSVVTLRRHNLFPYLLGPLFTAALALSLLVLPISVPLIFAVGAMAVSVLVLCYLDGPAAYVRVSGSGVVVANVFGVHRIPRAAIERVGGYANLGVDLFLVGGKEVPVTAFEPSLNPWGRSRGEYARLGRGLERALESVPPQGADIRYRWRPRYSSIVLSVAALGLLAVAYFWAAPLASSA
jgi:hypothetical protein